MAAGDNLEVYSKNSRCGDPEVHGGIVSHHETRRYRKMNYMGKREVNAGTMLAKALFGRTVPPPGTYYFYQCPVCGSERCYFQERGRLVEFDAYLVNQIL